jgi:hypothetical protein
LLAISLRVIVNCKRINDWKMDSRNKWGVQRSFSYFNFNLSSSLEVFVEKTSSKVKIGEVFFSGVAPDDFRRVGGVL